MNATVAFTSLGCDKNRVDIEVTITVINQMCLYCVYHSRDTTPTISIRASSTDNNLR